MEKKRQKIFQSTVIELYLRLNVNSKSGNKEEAKGARLPVLESHKVTSKRKISELGVLLRWLLAIRVQDVLWQHFQRRQCSRGICRQNSVLETKSKHEVWLLQSCTSRRRRLRSTWC